MVIAIKFAYLLCLSVQYHQFICNMKCSIDTISCVSTSTKVEKLRPYTQCWKHLQTLVPCKPYALLHAKENIQKQLSKFCWVSRWMCVRFGSFFRHLWNISSNDYLKWFSTGKPKGQEKIHPQAISRCGMCFTKNIKITNMW